LAASIPQPADERRAIFLLGGAYLALGSRMLSEERSMRRTGGPGIVGFELAGSPRRAEEILALWGPTGRAAARRSLLIDYPYLASYGPLLMILCNRSARRLASRRQGRLARLGPTLGRAQLVAAGLDAVENTALLAVLAGGRGRLPALARASAVAKFALTAAGVAYVCAGLAPRR